MEAYDAVVVVVEVALEVEDACVAAACDKAEAFFLAATAALTAAAADIVSIKSGVGFSRSLMMFTLLTLVSI